MFSKHGNLGGSWCALHCLAFNQLKVSRLKMLHSILKEQG